MDNLKKYWGVLLIVIGTIMLLVSHYCGLVDYNWFNALALLLIVGGIVAHIILSKKFQD